jgi:hypothetical protein
MGDAMNYCTLCKTMKEDSEFSITGRNTQTVLCLECAAKAKENFYKRVKSGETTKGKARVEKPSRKAPKKPEGSVLKRCPFCNANVWVIQTDSEMCCWKCSIKLKISQALRNSAYHRHGVILSVIN